MLIAERRQQIIDLVNEQKSIRVTELSNIFSITEETIRRDLESLKKQGKLMRSHGGAVSINSVDLLEVSYEERESRKVDEKRKIAYEAVKQVREGDKIILDASTTAWYMAKVLPDMEMTVLTNSIKVASELSPKKNITVISTGGILQSKSLSYVGPLAESSFKHYHANKAFISCKGFHLQDGISESSEQQARVKQMMLSISEEVYLMIDHSKFGVKAFSRYEDMDVIDYVITDHHVKSELERNLIEKGFQLIKTKE